MRLHVPAALLVLSTLPLVARAQTPHVKESRPGLLRQAKITPEVAMRAALQAVPNGQVQEAEIEREKGKLVYSYDIKVAGQSGIEEVLVDARTGAVVSHTHESPAAEAAEARQDARQDARTTRKGRPTSPDRR